MTTSEIMFNGLKISHILKPALKNSYISISKDCSITLKTPKVSKEYIQSLLMEKETWIQKQLFKLKQNPPLSVNLEDEVMLFGEIYSIDSFEAKTLRESLHRLKNSNKENIIKCYDNFYRQYAKEYLNQRAKELSEYTRLKYSELKFRKMKNRWGSCNSKAVITLNTKLIKIDKDLIDYVIVHELSHLVHMNHSKEFHSLLNSFMPNSKALEQRLRSTHLLD